MQEVNEQNKQFLNLLNTCNDYEINMILHELGKTFRLIQDVDQFYNNEISPNISDIETKFAVKDFVEDINNRICLQFKIGEPDTDFVSVELDEYNKNIMITLNKYTMSKLLLDKYRVSQGVSVDES